MYGPEQRSQDAKRGALDLPKSVRVQRARIAAFHLHAKYDSRDLTAPARSAFNQRFYELADPTGELPVKERERRALLLRRAYFAGLALKSSRARERRTARRESNG